MPPRIPDDKRSEILDDIRANAPRGKSRGQIARDYDVSTFTVSKIAEEGGCSDAFNREQTKNATEAAVVDAKARRAALAQKFLAKADQLLDQIDQPHTVFNFGGKDNTFAERTLNRPPTGDIRNLMIAAATAFDKHMAAERHDSDSTGLAAVDEWLQTMLGGK